MDARVVSLVPSATETLLAWGIRPVAVTRFCEQPDFPTVGGTKNPDVDAIVALAPDLVVMCTEENRREDFDELRAAGLTVHAVDIDAVDDVGPAMRALAAAVRTPPPADEPLADPAATEVRAFVPIWRRPWMSIGGGCYGASMLARLGIGNVYADAAERYPGVELADARARGVDVVLAPSEPYAFTERHRAELEQVAPVVFVDGKDLFWWGARTPGATRRLALALEGVGRSPSG